MLRIMVVDDEAMHLMNLIGMIQILKPSYIIFSAKDGRQALEIMHTFQVDLLITDIRMPNMDGLTLISRAKSMYPDLYTVILSGHGEFEYARKAIDLDVDGYLLKTLDQEDLIKIMDDLERKQRNRQELRRCEQAQQQVIEQIQMDQLERDVAMLMLGCSDAQMNEQVRELIVQYESGMVICTKPLRGSWDQRIVSAWKNQIAAFLGEWGHAYTFRYSNYSSTLVTDRKSVV